MIDKAQALFQNNSLVLVVWRIPLDLFVCSPYKKASLFRYCMMAAFTGCASPPNIGCNERELVNYYDSLSGSSVSWYLVQQIASIVHVNESELIINTKKVRKQNKGVDCGLLRMPLQPAFWIVGTQKSKRIPLQTYGHICCNAFWTGT